MRVLLLTSSFAPVATAHSERAVAIARLLKQCGHEVHVVTLDRALYDTIAVNYEPAGFADSLNVVPSGFHSQLKANKNLRLLRGMTNLVAGFPGPFVYEARRVLTFVETQKDLLRCDCVWVTTPPHELQLAGYQLSVRHGIPYVMDLRDPWGESRRIRWFTPLHRASAQAWYRKCLSQAAAIVTNTPLHFETVKKTDLSVADRLYCVPNGYFESDFQEAERFALPKRLNESPLVVYAGNLYGGNVETALHGLYEAALRRGRSIRVRLLGASAGEFPFEYAGVTSPAGIARHAVAADWLFLHMPHNATEGPVMSLKAYLYARSGKPVIYEGPKNETYDYLKCRTKVIYYSDPDVALSAAWDTRDASEAMDRLEVAATASWESRWPQLEAIARRAGSVRRATQTPGTSRRHLFSRPAQ